MAKRRTTKAEERADKKRAKLASYNAPKQDRKPSKYRLRFLARRRGEPMADRSGERAPWWHPGLTRLMAITSAVSFAPTPVRGQAA